MPERAEPRMPESPEPSLREWKEEVRRRLAGARLPAAAEAEVAEELAQHLADHYEELRARGVEAGEARRLTLEELAGEESLGDGLRGAVRGGRSEPVPLGAQRGSGPLASLWNDMHFGVRLLRRNPAFTTVAILTLALGIGANTAIFSIVNALLLRPLPGVDQPDDLVQLGRTDAGQGFDTFSYPDFLEYTEGTRTLSGVAAHSGRPVHLSTGGASERVRAQLVSGSYFGVLGVRPARGRLLQHEDDLPGAPPALVLGHGLWKRRFAADPDIVGRTVRINGTPFTVAGVADERFRGIEIGGESDLYVPLTMVRLVIPDVPDLLTERGGVWLSLFGRLAPGATVEAAQAELSGIAGELQRLYPETNRVRGIQVAPGLGFHPSERRTVQAFMAVLLGVVLLVLLIACANVANLLLARGTTRAREVAIRASLGASRSRLLRQLMTEGLLLAFVAAAVGLLVGLASLRLVLRLPIFADAQVMLDVAPDLRVLAFTAAVALLSGVLFGLPPAFRASRLDLVPVLKAGTAGSGDARSRLRHGLLIAQLALSLVLLAAAGLFLRTLQALYTVEPGFATREVLLASVDVGLQGYHEAEGRRFYAELVREAAALPGVRDAALAAMLPLGGGGWDTRIFPAEITPDPDDPGAKTDLNAVSPDYFATVGMPILRGRGFTAADHEGAPAVAVVNEALAARLWPGEDPLGMRFRMGREGAVLEVVGVVGTAKYRSLLEEPRLFFYRPFAQAYQPAMTLHLRAAGDPHLLRPALERVVARLDKDLPVFRVETLAERLDRSLGSQRTAAMLVGVYGALALLLAAVGLYGSMAYAVSLRTREIGIRMALGARAPAVLRHVLRDAARIAGLGIVLGLLAAIPATRLLRGQLFGVSPTDPATLAAVVLLLAASALAAAYLPARRATRVDPVIALRAEA